MLLLALLGLTLGLTPYNGPPLSGSIPGTAKFQVTVRGTPGQTVDLRAIDVPVGYIASFCTTRVCAPFRVSVELPRSGRDRIELQLIENEPGARKPHSVVVTANGRTRASIPFGRATH